VNFISPVNLGAVPSPNLTTGQVTWGGVVGVAPTQTLAPNSQSIASGSPVTFTGAFSGTDPITYQWQRNNGSGWANVSGATSASYTFDTAGADDGAQFRLVATNAYGSTNGTAATLTVTSAVAPTITVQPTEQIALFVGDNVTFTVTATGTAPLTYQWQYATGSYVHGVLTITWVNIVGATSASWTHAATLDDASKRFRCVVSNGYGNATSDTTDILFAVSGADAVTAPTLTADGNGVLVSGLAIPADSTEIRIQVCEDDGLGAPTGEWIELVAQSVEDDYLDDATAAENPDPVDLWYRVISDAGGISTLVAVTTAGAPSAPAAMTLTINTIGGSGTDLTNGQTLDSNGDASFSVTAGKYYRLNLGGTYDVDFPDGTFTGQTGIWYATTGGTGVLHTGIGNAGATCGDSIEEMPGSGESYSFDVTTPAMPTNAVSFAPYISRDSWSSEGGLDLGLGSIMPSTNYPGVFAITAPDSGAIRLKATNIYGDTNGTPTGFSV
jgi:hypothetical protein